MILSLSVEQTTPGLQMQSSPYLYNKQPLDYKWITNAKLSLSVEKQPLDYKCNTLPICRTCNPWITNAKLSLSVEQATPGLQMQYSPYL